MINKEVLALWPELEWIQDEDLRNKEPLLNIPISKFKSIERYIRKNYTTIEIDEILRLIKDLRKIQIKDLFKSYPDMCLDLAKNRGKSIVPFNIEGGNFLIDDENYSEFALACVHLFRNAVDHGIESEDDRLNNNKQKSGIISFSISKSNGDLLFVIEDDGKGINTEKIKDKIIEKNILEESKVNRLSDKEIMEYIFSPYFSTADKVTDISGRGVGLNALKDIVNKMNGNIDLESAIGKGTTIKVILPYID